MVQEWTVTSLEIISAPPSRLRRSVTPCAYGARFLRLRLSIRLNPLRLPPVSSEFPDEPRQSFVAAYRWRAKRESGSSSDARSPPWPSVGYKDATSKLSCRSAQNCGRALGTKKGRHTDTHTNRYFQFSASEYIRPQRIPVASFNQFSSEAQIAIN